MKKIEVVYLKPSEIQTNFGNPRKITKQQYNELKKSIETQKSSGGLTEMYKTFGTYIKSFYSVMFNPSCVKISTMGKSDRRIHHKINWSNAIPMIIEERYKK